jgi:diguanylate cyclase (GGDEF)-like protein
MLFSDRLDMAISKAARDKTKVAVMFLDLDRFKTINDKFGHNIGDMLLQSAAGVLRSCLRDSDTVARLGGDEFTVLLSSISNREDAAKVARKILSAVNQKWNLAGHKLHLTTSAGISIYPDDGSDSETLVRKADTSMYSAKANGGNAYRFYEPHMDAGSAEQIQLENDLRCALDNGELSIYYQPQFDMLTRQISGVEALLRWKHPARGLISPECFIPIAEKTGIIVLIGEWVLKAACKQVGKWHAKGHSFLNLSVNVSGIQLAAADFTDIVERILKKTRFDSSRLRLEITESVALQNLESIVPKLEKLTGIGVQFVIDDFGMGYSSLHYLKRLPIQSIKIDKSFMQEIYKNGEDASAVTAMIAMAKSLNLDTVAEGVETNEQLAFLNKCRCDRMQGYLYSHPMPPEMLESLLKA